MIRLFTSLLIIDFVLLPKRLGPKNKMADGKFFAQAVYHFSVFCSLLKN